MHFIYGAISRYLLKDPPYFLKMLLKARLFVCSLSSLSLGCFMVTDSVNFTLQIKLNCDDKQKLECKDLKGHSSDSNVL